MSRKTKIIATVGPSSRSEDTIRAMIESGVDSIRLHFSYADQDEHKENLRRIRNVGRRMNKSIPIIQDLGGTKLRLTEFSGGESSLELQEDDAFAFQTQNGKRSSVGAGLNFPDIFDQMEMGDKIFVNDAAISMKVNDVSPGVVNCEVQTGGIIKPHQAVHLPRKEINQSVPTKKDLNDIQFGIDQGMEWVAISYAKGSEEIRRVREYIHDQKCDMRVIAKIERKEAFERLDDILSVADGIMVARGDLGLEMPIEQVALTQKEIISRSKIANKPVITATEVLSSMIHQPKPTRAEVSDITNAIIDGTDAILLSGETSIGEYPIETVKTACRVIEVVERVLGEKPTFSGLQT